MVALLDDQDVNGTIGMSMQPVGYFHYMPNGSTLPFALPVRTEFFSLMVFQYFIKSI